MSDVVRVAFEVRWSLKCNVKVELRVNQVYNYRNVVVKKGNHSTFEWYWPNIGQKSFLKISSVQNKLSF